MMNDPAATMAAVSAPRAPAIVLIRQDREDNNAIATVGVEDSNNNKAVANDNDIVDVDDVDADDDDDDINDDDAVA